MARPEKSRHIHEPPLYTEFRTVGFGSTMEAIIMSIDEYEAIRLSDMEGMTHEQAAEEMGISRPTFTRLLDSAHKKIAKMLVQGKRLIIEGGNVNFRFMIMRCADCGHMFRTRSDQLPEECPVCGSKNLILMAPPFGRNYKHRGGRGSGRGGPWRKGHF